MKLLLTNHAYDDVGLRMGGVFLFAIGMIVAGMIINKASRAYPVTLFVRAFIITALLVLYEPYVDPALLAISLVVVIGWALTFLSWRKEKAEQGAMRTGDRRLMLDKVTAKTAVNETLQASNGVNHPCDGPANW